MNSTASDPGESASAGVPRIALGTGRALVPVPPVAPSASIFAGLGRSHGYVAAGVAVVMGLGFVAGTLAFASKSQPAALAQAAPPSDTTMDVLYRVQGEVRQLKAGLDGLRTSAEENRQAETIRGLKKSVDTLKGDLDGVKAASNAAVGQLGAKLDRLDRDPGPKLAEISARLDKLDHEPEAKIAQVAARLDRVERQVSSAEPTGSVPPQGAAAMAAQVKAPMPPLRAPQAPAPAVAAAPVTAIPPTRSEVAKVEPAKPEPVVRPDPSPRPDVAKVERPPEAAARPATIDGWMLRDVYGGVALLEGRAGSLREVAPGEYIPGVGEVRSIERRGRGWVVVTSRGLIQADNRW